MVNLHEMFGKTIGVVYTFEGEDALGFTHYHVWQSDIISKWLLAIQDLKCRPLILDVRTFVEKAICGTLPNLDYVLNLNCGGCELSPMALIPSVCAFLHIPCIPCNASAILTGENKFMSNQIAKATGLQVPKTLNKNITGGIFRPLNLGSSIGVKREFSSFQNGIYQEFIRGYDITTPIIYNPVSQRMDIMPTVLYIAENDNVEWFLGEECKNSRSGFIRQTIFDLSDKLKEKYLELTHNIAINTFCRIDARIKCSSSDELKFLLKKPLQLEDVYFIEINPMPTVWINNAFSHSFSEINKAKSFAAYLSELKQIIPEITLHNFLLSIAILAFITTM